MPIDVIISPELEVARAIARRLEVPGATEVMPFADDRVRLIARALRAGLPDPRHAAAPADLPVPRPAPDRGRRSPAATASSCPTRRRPSCRRRRGLFVVETSHVGRAHARLRPRGADGRADRDRRRRQYRPVPRRSELETTPTRRSTLKLIELDAERAALRGRPADPHAWSCRATSRDREILEEANCRAAEAIVTRHQQRRGQHHGGAAGQAARLPPQALALVNNSAYAT